MLQEFASQFILAVRLFIGVRLHARSKRRFRLRYAYQEDLGRVEQPDRCRLCHERAGCSGLSICATPLPGQLRQPARGGCKSGCALQGKQRKQTIISPGTLVRTWGTQRFAYYRGGAGKRVRAMRGSALSCPEPALPRVTFEAFGVVKFFIPSYPRRPAFRMEPVESS